jgi:hypothetical protein
MPSLKTDKIGLAAYLIVRGKRLSDVEVKSRNRSLFQFDVPDTEASALELEYMTSEFFRYYEAFRLLRDRTIRGA